MINLRNYNTYKIDTSCAYLYKPSNIGELINLIEMLEKDNIKYLILGGGSNVILPDKPFNGAIIKLDIQDFKIDNDFVFAGAGLNLNEFIKTLIDAGFTNLTNLYGIPGTLGGAIHGNAGVSDIDTFTYLESVLVYQDKDLKLINAHNINYGYRYAEFSNNTIILGAIFSLKKGSTTDAYSKIKENLEKRKNNQPLEYPSAGSVFKNPKNLSAGKLIDECGLKGRRIGDAQVSCKHANFIINLGNATSKDIISLIEEIKKEVKKNKNIDLELEQIIIKW